VEGSKRNGKHCGLCGQAPSDYPEMADFLVEIGIDSMSLNPDTVLQTTQQVLETEKRLGVLMIRMGFVPQLMALEKIFSNLLNLNASRLNI
jgi:phosphoenolpyruvate-protein kinase (PTS system EI component)